MTHIIRLIHTAFRPTLTEITKKMPNLSVLYEVVNSAEEHIHYITRILACPDLAGLSCSNILAPSLA